MTRLKRAMLVGLFSLPSSAAQNVPSQHTMSRLRSVLDGRTRPHGMQLEGSSYTDGLADLLLGRVVVSSSASDVLLRDRDLVVAMGSEVVTTL